MATEPPPRAARIETWIIYLVDKRETGRPIRVLSHAHAPAADLSSARRFATESEARRCADSIRDGGHDLAKKFTMIVQME